ncbi:hypothetical protein [Stratiformator vulcanicus]|uniref:Uncharacterized protein n=1 Tax=Stratiformator vulcanicus TaxID=2527980 RepID=A0A517R3K9_9PLAN|nr:hypothetical protein [Stratiformator vulcanicus]QDT38478.1 hypothetical protein Pan189_28720 [Stratiformator vulcanicus]
MPESRSDGNIGRIRLSIEVDPKFSAVKPHRSVVGTDVSQRFGGVFEECVDGPIVVGNIRFASN